MRQELNAPQSPLTMGNSAQCVMVGSRFALLVLWPRLARRQRPIKNPCPRQGVMNVVVLG